MKVSIKVSKLDAARRQLETAVRLYFSESDPVSIHTLVSAAYQILADVNSARGGLPMLKEQIPTWVRPDAKAAAKQRLNEAANFFKHADRDHNEVLEFIQSPTEILLYDAIQKYRELTGELVPTLGVYTVWYGIGPGSDLVTDPEKQRGLEDIRRTLPNLTRATFFKEALPILASISV